MLNAVKEQARGVNDPLELIERRHEAVVALDACKGVVEIFDAEIERRYGECGRLALEKARKTHGKVSVDLPGGLKLSANVTQRVEWDQDKLQAIAKSMPDMEQINHYFDIKFGVPEKIYKAIPPGDLRKKFEDARTTKLGDLKITLERKDAATADQAAGG